MVTDQDERSGNVGIRETGKTTATDIEMFRKLLDSASVGDNVGVLLRGMKKTDVERGMALAKPVPLHLTPNSRQSCMCFQG